MKVSVIKEMSTDEIREKIENERNMLVKLRMNHAVSHLENPLKITYTKRTVARLLTELRQRELSAPVEEEKKQEVAEKNQMETEEKSKK